jgi:hypothetical protein
MVGHIISLLESGSDIKANYINLFTSIKMIESSLKSISNQTIINCFRKAFFNFSSITTQIEISSEENDSHFWQNLKNLTDIEFESFDSFVRIDDKEVVEFQNDLNDDQIVELIKSQKFEETIEISDEEYEESEEPTIISRAKALDSIYNLQKYFGQIDDYSFTDSLNQIKDKIIENSFKSLKQTKICDFFG